jgi:uncharacterized protein (TIGR00251 family)
MSHAAASLAVHVTPRAHETAIVGWRGEVLYVRVVAPPVDGRANAAVEQLLASALGLPRRDVQIVAGAGSRQKLVRVDGLDDQALRRLLGR